MRALGATLLIMLLLAATGCSRTNFDSPSRAEPWTSAKEPRSHRGPGPASCWLVPKRLVHRIASGQRDGVGMQVQSTSAVTSSDNDPVFLVAMKFSVVGVDDPQIGVWARTTGGGPIFAVDGPAQEFTDWPPTDETEAAISPAHDSVDDALACLKSAGI